MLTISSEALGMTAFEVSLIVPAIWALCPSTEGTQEATKAQAKEETERKSQTGGAWALPF